MYVRSIHMFFCKAHPIIQPPNPMLYNAFQSARHPKSAHSHGGIYTHVMRFLDPPNSPIQTASRSVKPFFHSSQHRVPIILHNMHQNAINVPWVTIPTDWVKALHPTWYKIGNFGDVLPSQSLGIVLKKLNLTQQKQTMQEQYSLS